MSGVFAPLKKVWDDVRKGKVPLPVVASIQPNKCAPAESAGYPIRRNEMYFTVRINEMYLSDNREWWSVYDPLVVVVCEFDHGSERVVVPTVVGPNLIQKQAPNDRPRHGVVLLDTRVTGPHPYRGGDLDISVAFYQVQRANHARTLLKVVDTLSTSLGDPGQMQTIAKAGAALLEGVEGLLGMAETTYLAGLRMSLANTPVTPLTAGFSALITPKAPDNAQLSVIERRLHVQSGGKVAPYRNSDFVLLSVTGDEARGDESKLPFYPLKTAALAAIWDGDGGLERAKANLIAAYQQMRTSPDMTAAEAGRLFDAWLAEFELEKKRLATTRSLPVEEQKSEGRRAKDSTLIEDFNGAMRRLVSVG